MQPQLMDLKKKRVWAVERHLFARITGSQPHDEQILSGDV
jgi:hypothetical protein